MNISKKEIALEEEAVELLRKSDMLQLDLSADHKSAKGFHQEAEDQWLKYLSLNPDNDDIKDKLFQNNKNYGEELIFLGE